MSRPGLRAPALPLPALTLDLRGLRCPENSMRATLHLDGMEEGEILELIVDGGQTLEVMVPNLAEEGYPVLSCRELGGGGWSVLVRA